MLHNDNHCFYYKTHVYTRACVYVHIQVQCHFLRSVLLICQTGVTNVQTMNPFQITTHDILSYDCDLFSYYDGGIVEVSLLRPLDIKTIPLYHILMVLKVLSVELRCRWKMMNTSLIQFF